MGIFYHIRHKMNIPLSSSNTSCVTFISKWSIQCHDCRNNTINLFWRLSLCYFDVLSSICFNYLISWHPSKYRITSTNQIAFHMVFNLINRIFIIRDGWRFLWRMYWIKKQLSFKLFVPILLLGDRLWLFSVNTYPLCSWNSYEFIRSYRDKYWFVPYKVHATLLTNHLILKSEKISYKFSILYIFLKSIYQHLVHLLCGSYSYKYKEYSCYKSK